MKKVTLVLFVLTFSICSFAKSNVDCNVGVRMIDAYSGEFEPYTLQIIKQGLEQKGYNVFETNYGDQNTDLIFDVQSDIIAHTGYTFEAKFISRKLDTTFAHSYRELMPKFPSLYNIFSHKKSGIFSKDAEDRLELFNKVAQDVMDKLPACDQL